MAPVYSKNQKGLGQIAEDHSAEAVSVLTMEPSKLIRRLVLVLASFLFAAVIWSFIGRLDTIVQAPGAVKPESQEMLDKFLVCLRTNRGLSTASHRTRAVQTARSLMVSGLICRYST